MTSPDFSGQFENSDFHIIWNPKRNIFNRLAFTFQGFNFKDKSQINETFIIKMEHSTVFLCRNLKKNKFRI